MSQLLRCHNCTRICCVDQILLVGFNGLDTVPSAFVLMGNFQSQPAPTASTDYSALRENFKTLGSIISQYQRLQVRALFSPLPSSSFISANLILLVLHLVSEHSRLKYVLHVLSGMPAIDVTSNADRRCRAVLQVARVMRAAPL